MLLGGCSNVSTQTLAFSETTKKFAFVGDAHCYVFDTKGQCKLDAIIPFCEKTQSKFIVEQKKNANLKVNETEDAEQIFRQTLLKRFVIGKESEKVVSFLSNRDLSSDEIWGGVGISCIDWHPSQPNLLAAVTLKKNNLEVWDTQTGAVVAIIELPDRIA